MPQDRLQLHSDDAELTLSVCLGRDFEGGAVEFRVGVVWRLHAPSLSHSFEISQNRCFPPLIN